VPMPYMLLTFFIGASIAMFWRTARGGAGLDWLAFYGLVALGFWAKGMAGLLPLAAAIVYAIATRRLGGWRALHLPAGVALVGVLIAPWWVLQGLSETGALRTVVMSDNLVWYAPRAFTLGLVTGPFEHVVGVLFPWVLVVPVVIWHALPFLRERGVERDAVHVLILWAAVLVGGVGLSDQQRLRYYLPLVVPASLLIGWWGARVLVKQRGVVAQIPWRIYGIAAGVVVLAAVVASARRPTWVNATHVAWPGSATEVVVMAGGLVLMIGALGYGLRRDALGRAFVFAWLGAALWVGGWYHWELERRNAAYDYPRAHTEAARLLPEAPVVAAWGVYELPFSFYFDRKVVAVATDGDLRRVMAEHPRASAVLTEAALGHVENRARLRVLPLNRLNFDSIVLVTPRAATGP